MWARLALFFLLVVPMLAKAQDPVRLDPLGNPLPVTPPQTSFNPYGRPLPPDARAVQIRVRTQYPEESLHLVIGYDRPFANLDGTRPIGRGSPLRRLLCTGPCTLTFLVGGRYELMVEAAPEDARLDRPGFPRPAEVAITERTIGLDVAFNPRRVQRRRRWLGIAGAVLVGGAMMGGSAHRRGEASGLAFSLGAGVAIFASCFVVIPIRTFGRTEVRLVEAP